MYSRSVEDVDLRVQRFFVAQQSRTDVIIGKRGPFPYTKFKSCSRASCELYILWHYLTLSREMKWRTDVHAWWHCRRWLSCKLERDVPIFQRIDAPVCVVKLYLLLYKHLKDVEKPTEKPTCGCVCVWVREMRVVGTLPASVSEWSTHEYAYDSWVCVVDREYWAQTCSLLLVLQRHLFI